MPRKVSDEDVEEMKSLRMEGLTYKEIAEEFDVSSSTVSRYLKDVKKEPEPEKEPPEEKEEPEQVESEQEEVEMEEEEGELSDVVKQRIKNFNEVGMSMEEISTRLEVPYSQVRDYLEEESLGFWDRLKRALGIG